jgi:hypothetical protein
MDKQNQNTLLNIICTEDHSIVWYFSGYNDKYIETGTREIKPVTFLRPQDKIILSDLYAVVKGWKWAQKVFGYTDDQAVWYRPFTSLSEKNSRHEEILMSFIGQKIIVICLTPDQYIRQACDNLGIKYYGDDLTSLPDKRWIHDTIPGSRYKSNIFNVVDFPKGVNVPRGYTCYNEDELRTARELLAEQGVKEIVVKPAFGLSGLGIKVVRDETEFEEYIKTEFLESYHNSMNYETPSAYLIEECIQFKCDGKFHYTPVVYFFDNNILSISSQVVEGSAFVGNTSKPFSDEIIKKVTEQANILCDVVSTFNKGPWGVDFLLDDNGEIYFTDPNLGRFNGGHYREIFQSIYAKGKCYFSMAIGDPDWEGVWEMLVEKGIQFNFETQKGIMLICPHSLDFYSKVCIFGDSENEVEELKEAYLGIVV